MRETTQSELDYHILDVIHIFLKCLNFNLWLFASDLYKLFDRQQFVGRSLILNVQILVQIEWLTNVVSGGVYLVLG